MASYRDNHACDWKRRWTRTRDNSIVPRRIDFGTRQAPSGRLWPPNLCIAWWHVCRPSTNCWMTMLAYWWPEWRWRLAGECYSMWPLVNVWTVWSHKWGSHSRGGRQKPKTHTRSKIEHTWLEKKLWKLNHLRASHFFQWMRDTRDGKRGHDLFVRPEKKSFFAPLKCLSD